LAAIVSTSALLVGSPIGSATAAAPKPCAATGIDPTKKAVHVNKKGKAKKLSEPENPGKLFGKGRVDRQDEDQERNWGEVATIAGFSTAVTSGGFVQSAGQFEEDGYIRVSVKICNRNDDAQGGSAYDFRLQTPAGQVLDPTIVVQAPTLPYVPTDLVKGGELAGDIYFPTGAAAPGEYFVIYKPDLLDESRGIWKVPV
jgi:hypothetical protein